MRHYVTAVALWTLVLGWVLGAHTGAMPWGAVVVAVGVTAFAVVRDRRSRGD